MRHQSPKTKNSFSSNYFIPQLTNDFNAFNLDNQRNMINNGSFNNFNFNYNINNYNYYDEIVKVFNFITFILRQKDTQIQRLKLKILELERKLKQVDVSNIIEINNKDHKELSIEPYNQKNVKDNNNAQNNINILFKESRKTRKNQRITIEDSSSNNNSNLININKKNNIQNKTDTSNSYKVMNENNVNVVHKIKNPTHNINDINKKIHFKNLNEGKKINYNRKFINEQPVKQINQNMSESSTERKNINNNIRREPYKNNNNNIKIKIKQINEIKNFTKSSGNLSNSAKIKTNLENTLTSSGHTESISNTYNMSEEENFISSKNDIKIFLKEVKKKLEPERFKKFITQIKALTKNKNNDKNSIIIKIRNLLVDKALINKFEDIMKVNI